VGNGDSLRFSWVKGFGLGSAIPNWLHFVLEWGEAVGGRGFLKFGDWVRVSKIARGVGGVWRASGIEIVAVPGSRSRRKRRCSCPALKRINECGAFSER